MRGVRISESGRDVVQKASRHRWSGQGGGLFQPIHLRWCPVPVSRCNSIQVNLSSPLSIPCLNRQLMSFGSPGCQIISLGVATDGAFPAVQMTQESWNTVIIYCLG